MFVALITAIDYLVVARPTFRAAAAHSGPSAFRSTLVDIGVEVVEDWSADGSALGPGGATTRRLRISNQSEGAMYYTISAYSDGPQSALWTDADNGLQIKVGAGTEPLYARPIAGLTRVARGGALEGYKSEELHFTVIFPVASGDEFQGLTQGVGFTFDASGR